MQLPGHRSCCLALIAVGRLLPKLDMHEEVLPTSNPPLLYKDIAVSTATTMY